LKTGKKLVFIVGGPGETAPFIPVLIWCCIEGIMSLQLVCVSHLFLLFYLMQKYIN